MSKALLISNSKLYHNMIKDALTSVSGATQLFGAANSHIALEILRNFKDAGDVPPEVIMVILDLNLMEEDPIDALKILLSSGNEIFGKIPGELPVSVLWDKNPKNAKFLAVARDAGIFHSIMTDINENYESNLTAVTRGLRVVLSRLHTLVKPAAAHEPQSEDRPHVKKTPPSLALIASSTGGPVALEELITALPKDLAVPVLVVQHMPPNFTKNLAKTLNKKAPLQVFEATQGDELFPGQVLIAPGGYHMEVDKTRSIYLHEGEYVNGVRPSADVLFSSVARTYRGESILAVILTGMGNDGKNGVMALKNSCNCFCITQSERTCAIYGMPKSVDEAGLSDKSLDIGDIAGELIRKIKF